MPEVFYIPSKLVGHRVKQAGQKIFLFRCEVNTLKLQARDSLSNTMKVMRIFALVFE